MSYTIPTDADGFAGINHMSVNTQPQDTGKFPVLKQLISDHVALAKIIASV